MNNDLDNNLDYYYVHNRRELINAFSMEYEHIIILDSDLSKKVEHEYSVYKKELNQVRAIFVACIVIILTVWCFSV